MDLEMSLGSLNLRKVFTSRSMMRWVFIALLPAISIVAQQPPYDQFPDAEPPYYRVRYSESSEAGKLIFPVKYTLWVPPNVDQLRGLIVHQHGCGEGSCKSGLTGAWDLHWQALAAKHKCALMAPSYEQPQSANCQMWCDPRNGSDAAFRRSLVDLGQLSGHPELATVPWALWGHSGGGHWAGGMTLLHPGRVAAAWLRSGVPLFASNPDREQINAYNAIPADVLNVPIMCNPGTKEGVSVKDGRFAGVWPANEKFLTAMRAKDGLVAVAIDPLSAHECGNQRYLSIPWFDAMLDARLPKNAGEPLRGISRDETWLAPFLAKTAKPAAEFTGDHSKASLLPSTAVAKMWTHYVRDTAVPDLTPPPSPTHVRADGQALTWQATADPESGIDHFIVRRGGKFLAKVQGSKNRFGRPCFQGLQYSDTPAFPLQQMRYIDRTQEPGKAYYYSVITVNTVGLKSE
jgi:pimeloyl-ACP methyl ester carboxylesterase